MTQTEALKLALEALETLMIERGSIYEKAITAIKAALEAKDEPWEKFCDSNCVWTDHHPDCKLAQRTWVGLTDEEISNLWSWSMTREAELTATTQQHAFVRAIEAKLKEKNT